MANNYYDKSYNGYRLKTEGSKGYNLKKFINSLDYSLDSINLRRIYREVYHRSDFSFKVGKKDYSYRVINVTFDYSVKEFNRISQDVYIRCGYHKSQLKWVDNLAFYKGVLIGVKTNSVCETLNKKALEGYFKIEDNCYQVRSNPTLYQVKDIRETLYENGFVVDGVKYVRMSRSSGSSRVGKCLFVDERLYSQFKKWMDCGLNITSKYEGDLAGYEAYISLTSSSIIDTIQIQPNNILLIDDFDSRFSDRAVATKFNGTNLTSEVEDIQVANCIWDGQSLMDSSLFGEYKDKGMLLLRNRFFKSCCFNANIQQWFKDNGITKIEQLNGQTIATDIKDIKLITTPSSIKYLKYSTWDNWLWTLDPMFGVVKFEKPTHFFDGRMVQAHYQLLNTIQLTKDEVEQLLTPSLEYLTLIKTNPSVLKYYIKYEYQPNAFEESANSKNEIIYKLLSLNDKFAQTALYHSFRQDVVKAYIKNLRRGHVLLEGTYCTLCGNPVEMLQQSIGKFSGERKIEKNTIYTKAFSDNEKLLGSRSPHVTVGNILLATNKIYPEIDTYFNFTKEIVCVNSIGENLLERLSGSDFDSDTLLLTNNKILIKGAERNYDNFLVPTKLVRATVHKRKFTAKAKAELDNKTAVNLIGEIINLSQELNSKMWDRINKGVSLEEVHQLYCDICQLDVMSNLDIDNAKRENPADNRVELTLLKKKYEERDDKDRYIRPLFFKYLDKDKGYYDAERKVYKSYQTTMDYIQGYITKYILSREKLPRYSQYKHARFSSILTPIEEIKGKVNYEQFHRTIGKIRQFKKEGGCIWRSSWLSESTKHELFASKQAELNEYLDKIKFNDKTLCYLLRCIECRKYSDVSRFIFNTLFSLPHKDFYRFIIKSKQPIKTIVEKENGAINIHNFTFGYEEN